MRALMWFRSDLRIADNTALHNACRDAERGVIAIFLPAGEQWRSHDFGAPKVDFLLRNVIRLRDALAQINVSLLVRPAEWFRDAPKVLLAVAEEYGCDALYFNEEYEVNERRRDESVRQTFETAGRGCFPFHDQTIVPPQALRTTSGHFYTVFTPFRRSWVEHLQRDGLPEVLAAPQPQPELVCPPDPPVESVAGFEPAPVLAKLWPEGEAEAERRLRRFAEAAIHAYQDRRDLPGEAATSSLSPYLAAGVISPRLCLQAAVAAGGDGLTAPLPGPAAWISELIWREFYRHVMVGFPRVSMNRPFKLVTEKVEWREDEESFVAWREGRTGVPLVDAGMRELTATGWMHNRVRMVAAQFLAKQLLLDWRLGERHFMQHLVDADLANNNGGWQWSASTGTDAAPYFRVFNPYTQGRRYDPEARYAATWLPELEGLDPAAVHGESAEAAAARSSVGYPEPIVDHKAARQRAIDAFKQI